jgi:hypothetical protein
MAIGRTWLGPARHRRPTQGPAVICARHGSAATAVDADVWDAICGVGADVGRLDAVGYPVVTRRDDVDPARTPRQRRVC